MIKAARKFRMNTSRRRTAIFASILANSLILGGCSSTPDWANPVEWYKGTRDWVAGTDSAEAANKEAAAKPVAGAEQGYPKLSSVPQRPAPPSEAEREAMASSLAADRESARYTDESIRRQSESVTKSDSAVRAAPSPQIVTPVAPSRPAPVSAPVPARVSAAPQSAAVPAPPPSMAQNAPAAPTLSPPQTVPTAVQPSAPQAAFPSSASISPPVAPIRSRAPELVRPAPQSGFVQADRFSTRFPAGMGPAPAPAASLPAAPVATVFFKSGSSNVTADARREIRRAAGLARNHRSRVVVIGHASSRTKNLDPLRHQMANFRISYDRAQAVARELVRQGVDQQAIEISAVSDSEPVYYEVMPAGEAGNRRVEIVLVN